MRTRAVCILLTGGDEIGESTRFQERVCLHAGEVHVCEFDDLFEANADDCRLSVAAKSETVAEASTQGNDIL